MFTVSSKQQVYEALVRHGLKSKYGDNYSDKFSDAHVQRIVESQLQQVTDPVPSIVFDDLVNSIENT
jgi:ABC-type oligopeptide transport system ATPase subunit